MERAVRLLWIRRLTVVLVAMAFAIMVVGSWVKATGSGLACPDWPACYGQWLPPFPSVENGGTDLDGQPVRYTQAQVLYEWGHRALVSLFAIPFVALVAITWRAETIDPLLRRLPLATGIVLIVQVLLGGATVLQRNPAFLTTAHLATATLIFFLLTTCMCIALLRPTPETEPIVLRTPTPGPVRFPGEGP